MNVLLAVDSSRSSHVIENAAFRPWSPGTAFFVVSVVDMRHWEGLPILIEDAKREAQSIIKNATDRLREAGYRVTSEMPEGSPKKLIPDLAKKWNADLIMVGSHGSNTATRFLLGSTARSVLRSAACSLEIVRRTPPKQGHGLKVLLATDGSQCSAKAVDEIAKRPWPPNTEVQILSVVRLLTVDVPSFAHSMGSDVVEELIKVGRERAEGAVSTALETLRASALRVSTATPIGDPRGAILDQAKEWDADLIVLGSHGRDFMEHFWLGSVAESVAEYAKCSVEVVR